MLEFFAQALHSRPMTENVANTAKTTLAAYWMHFLPGILLCITHFLKTFEPNEAQGIYTMYNHFITQENSINLSKFTDRPFINIVLTSKSRFKNIS